MSTALACGALCTPKAQELFSRVKNYMDSNPLSYILVQIITNEKVFLFALDRALKNRDKAVSETESSDRGAIKV